uniref:Bridging integrator 3 n=2 Tax=Eptatretus burgeri TaxID=7764 RepID=A0A8C4QHY5_EPTBU
MSWNRFKNPEPKRPVVSKAAERDFEREHDRLLELDEQMKKLYKKMKKCMEADSAMTKAALKITADLKTNQVCVQEESVLRSIEALDLALHRMDTFNQEKINQVQKTVIDPLKKFSNVFPNLSMAEKRREQALQEYKKLQARVEKYEERERTGPNIVKLHQAREELRPAREEFEQRNKALLEEMPLFYNSRSEYFQPSFEALVRTQVNFYTDVSKIFKEVSEQLDEPDLTDEQRKEKNESLLHELRSLSIVAHD